MSTLFAQLACWNGEAYFAAGLGLAFYVFIMWILPLKLGRTLKQGFREVACVHAFVVSMVLIAFVLGYLIQRAHFVC